MKKITLSYVSKWSSVFYERYFGIFRLISCSKCGIRHILPSHLITQIYHDFDEFKGQLLFLKTSFEDYLRSLISPPPPTHPLTYTHTSWLCASSIVFFPFHRRTKKEWQETRCRDRNNGPGSSRLHQAS